MTHMRSNHTTLNSLVGCGHAAVPLLTHAPLCAGPHPSSDDSPHDVALGSATASWPVQLEHLAEPGVDEKLRGPWDLQLLQGCVSVLPLAKDPAGQMAQPLLVATVGGSPNVPPKPSTQTVCGRRSAACVGRAW